MTDGMLNLCSLVEKSADSRESVGKLKVTEETGVSVQATALRAVDLGYKVILLKESAVWPTNARPCFGASRKSASPFRWK